MRQVIDIDGFRPNVGIVLLNADNRVFWARRCGRNVWQFPQGGIKSDETPLDAMYRELQEETGLNPDDVEVCGSTRGWLRYRLPKRLQRRNQKPLCIGQKQVWFVLKLRSDESAFQLDACNRPEFDRWRWIEYWEAIDDVVFFKRRVYERALRELAPMAFPAPETIPPRPPRKEAAPEHSGSSHTRVRG